MDIQEKLINFINFNFFERKKKKKYVPEVLKQFLFFFAQKKLKLTNKNFKISKCSFEIT